MHQEIYITSLQESGICLVSRVECPSCHRIKSYRQLIAIKNVKKTKGKTLTGSALVSKCCMAIVIKEGNFDFNRGLLGSQRKGFRSLKGRISGQFFLPSEPEFIERFLKIHARKMCRSHIVYFQKID